jgi:endonuclease YncB( thermonuclease family)
VQCRILARVKPRRFLVALFVLLYGLAAHAATQSFDGRVVSVADGDTVTVLDNNNIQHKIRVAGIDAPEKGQPFGDRSKQSLSRAVMGKTVRIEWEKQDRYGRLVGKVWVAPLDATCQQTPCPKTLDAGLAQLTVGLAWHFKKYEKEQSEEDRLRYSFAEEEARARKAGLWSQPDPTPPWQWRSGDSTGITTGPVKKSKSGICHTAGSSSYASVKNFTPYPTLDACIASGGRLPKQSGD